MNLNPSDIKAEIHERVRTNALSAAFGAACLIYFGYFVSGTPTVTNLFSAGDAVFVFTLRIGGVLLLLAAVLCWTGMLPALMADAIISGFIGVLLISSALMMMAGGGGMGINQILYIVFGVMFTGAGLRNGRDFMSLRKLLKDAEGFQGQPHIPQSTVPPVTPTAPIEQASPIESTTGSLASELRRRKSVPTDQPADDPYANEEPAEEGFAASDAVDNLQSDAPALEESHHDDSNDDEALLEDSSADDSPPDQRKPREPPPDGFLSSFADEDSPLGL